MKQHLNPFLYSALILIGLHSSAAAQGIVATQATDGRVVYENAPASVPVSAVTTEAQPAQTDLVYWSNTEHRWKPVPALNSNPMRAAQSAALEVRRLIRQEARKDPRFAANGSALRLASEQVKEAQPEAKPTPDVPVEAKASAPTIAVEQKPAPVTMASVSVSTISPRAVAPELAPAAPKKSAGPVHAPETRAWIDSVVEQAALRHDVDPNLVRAIIKVESNFNPHAVSRKGAVGLMQLMPGTAKSLNVSNAFDPKQNVEAGVRHFKQLLDAYNGDVTLSLAAYNAGAGAVQKKGGVPNYAETKSYVKRITELYGSKTTARLKSDHPLQFTRDAEGHLSVSDID